MKAPLAVAATLMLLAPAALITLATLTACLVTAGGRSAWFVGVLILIVYLIFAMTLYLLPPRDIS